MLGRRHRTVRSASLLFAAFAAYVFTVLPPASAQVPGEPTTYTELAQLRADCEQAFTETLTAERFHALVARLRPFLAADVARDERLSALRLGARLGWEGPPAATEPLREQVLTELAALAADSPRARVILTEQCLPPLPKVAPAEQPALLARFDALVERCLAGADPVARRDLRLLQCRARIEVHRGWPAAWLDAAELARVEAWLAALEQEDGEAPGGGPYRELAPALRSELRATPFGESLADLTLPDLNEGRVSLADYRGRVVVLSFWSTWCLPCLALAPQERELLRRFAPRGVALIGVNSDPTPLQARQTVARHQLDWPHVWSPPEAADGLVARLHIRQWPSIVILDRHGAIRAKFVGSLYQGTWTVADVERELERILEAG